MKKVLINKQSNPDVCIRAVEESDAEHIAEIYNYYILHSTATFEEQPVTPEVIRQRIVNVTQDYPWLICLWKGQILGYAYAARWKERSAYKNTTEVTAYFHHEATGKGWVRLYIPLYLNK